MSNSFDLLIRPLIAIILLGLSVLAAGQLSGQFYLEKSTFAPGEPIFLYFRVVNDAAQAENILSADPYSFCSGYQVSVSSDTNAASSCAPVGFVGNCLSPATALAPGKKHTERLLLNFDHRVDAPGQYSVVAVRHLSHARASVEYFSPDVRKDTLEVHVTLYFRVYPNATLDLSTVHAFVHQLRSPDFWDRREAARTLAAIAPPSLEGVLLAFASNTEFSQFAPMALYRLRTPRSMRALADLMRKTEVGSYENIASANYLAESGKSQWFPLLEDVARKHAQISNYVDDAAELGGDRMLPTLIALTQSSDRKFTVINGVTGMGYTGSRAAVPILIEFLKSPDSDVRDRARCALHLLTHRTANSDMYDNLQSQYAAWSKWWVREGPIAPVYKITECGASSPLP